MSERNQPLSDELDLTSSRELKSCSEATAINREIGQHERGSLVNQPVNEEENAAVEGVEAEHSLVALEMTEETGSNDEEEDGVLPELTLSDILQESAYADEPMPQDDLGQTQVGTSSFVQSSHPEEDERYWDEEESVSEEAFSSEPATVDSLQSNDENEVMEDLPMFGDANLHVNWEQHLSNVSSAVSIPTPDTINGFPTREAPNPYQGITNEQIEEVERLITAMIGQEEALPEDSYPTQSAQAEDLDEDNSSLYDSIKSEISEEEFPVSPIIQEQSDFEEHEHPELDLTNVDVSILTAEFPNLGYAGSGVVATVQTQPVANDCQEAKEQQQESERVANLPGAHDPNHPFLQQQQQRQTPQDQTSVFQSSVQKLLARDTAMFLHGDEMSFERAVQQERATIREVAATQEQIAAQRRAIIVARDQHAAQQRAAARERAADEQRAALVQNAIARAEAAQAQSAEGNNEQQAASIVGSDVHLNLMRQNERIIQELTLIQSSHNVNRLEGGYERQSWTAAQAIQHLQALQQRTISSPEFRLLVTEFPPGFEPLLRSLFNVVEDGRATTARVEVNARRSGAFNRHALNGRIADTGNVAVAQDTRLFEDRATQTIEDPRLTAEMQVELFGDDNSAPKRARDSEDAADQAQGASSGQSGFGNPTERDNDALADANHTKRQRTASAGLEAPAQQSTGGQAAAPQGAPLHFHQRLRLGGASASASLLPRAPRAQSPAAPSAPQYWNGKYEGTSSGRGEYTSELRRAEANAAEEVGALNNDSNFKEESDVESEDGSKEESDVEMED